MDEMLAALQVMANMPLSARMSAVTYLLATLDDAEVSRLQALGNDPEESPQDMMLYRSMAAMVAQARDAVIREQNRQRDN